jgi:hypothetical protein
MRLILNNIWLVFRQWQYLLLTILIIGVFYALNALVSQWSTLAGTFDLLGVQGALQLVFNLVIGYSETIDPLLHGGLIVTAILLGILFSLVLYKIRIVGTVSGKHGTVSAIGVLFGIVAPSCAACGIGILSALGFSVIALHALPFKGFELSLLSILILIGAIASVSRNLTNCKLARD